MKQKFYSSKKIRALNCTYSLTIGERSNGKTYDALYHVLEDYTKHGKQSAYVRRWEDDFRGYRGRQLFEGLVANGEVVKQTKGEYTNIKYVSHAWYLYRHDDELNVDITDPTPLMYGFALSTYEHDKSTSYPNVCSIYFDEFLTRGSYMPDEFVTFMQVVSTIVRSRNDVKIFMLANTVNKSAPYFSEMGLNKVKSQQQGTIDVYKYGDSGLTVAVEYCDNTAKTKESNVYFAFDNPALSMITGGAWEMSLYPHLPYKYTPSEVVFTYFIIWDGDILQCEVINHDGDMFTYIHRKTTPLQDPDNDLIYSMEYDPRVNWSRDIKKPRNKTEERVAWFFRADKVFYQDNEVGEIVRNYLNAQ